MEPTENPLEKFFQNRKNIPGVGTTPEPGVGVLETVKSGKMWTPPVQDNTDQPIDVDGLVKSKVAPDKLEQIKQEFSPAPPMAEAPMQPLQPRHDIVNPQKVQNAASSMMPEQSWTDILPHLAPLAVEALMGNANGESLGISGGSMLAADADRVKRQRSLEDEFMKVDRARAIAAAKAHGKSSLKTLEVDVDGKPIITQVENALGKQAWKKPGSESSALTFDQRLALQANAAKLKKEMDAWKKKGKDAEKKIDLEKYYGTERTKDAFTKDTRKVADAYNKLVQLDPDSKDPIQDVAIIFDFMKTLDPGSVVRESEQGLVMGAKSVGDLVDNLKDIVSKNRKLTPDQVRNIQKFAARNYQKRLESQESQVDSRYKGIAKKYGLDESVIVDDLSIGVPMMWHDRKTGNFKILSVPKNKVKEYEDAGAVRNF